MSEAKIQLIENDRRITQETDCEFLYELQKALLLALVESGRLSEEQYRYAEDVLRRNMFSAHS